jgi:hypothetical protein
MESCELFVEIDSKEVEIPCSGSEDGLIMSEDVVEVCRCLGGNWPNLFIAARVSWYEEYWDTFDLIRN